MTVFTDSGLLSGILLYFFFVIPFSLVRAVELNWLSVIVFDLTLSIYID